MSGVFLINPYAFGVASSPPALVNSAGNFNNSSSSSVAATFAASATASAGNLLVACAATSNETASITSSGWTSVITNNNAGTVGGVAGAILWKIASGGETGVTASSSLSATSFGVEVMEFSGLVPPSSDKTGTNTTTTSTSTTEHTGATGTLSAGTEIAVALVGLRGSSGSPSWSSSFVPVFHGSGGLSSVMVGYLFTGATTSLDPTATWSGSRVATGMIATFKGP